LYEFDMVILNDSSTRILNGIEGIKLSVK